MNQFFSSGPISRINDLDPDDIERIEIIKGPAAATLYGTEASTGVINIITKQGAVGPPRWTVGRKVRHELAARSRGALPDQLRSRHAGNVISVDIVELENARGTPIFRTGRSQQYHLASAAGARSSATTSPVGTRPATAWSRRTSCASTAPD